MTLDVNLAVPRTRCVALTGGVASMPTTSYGSTPNGLVETRALDGNSVELNEHVEACLTGEALNGLVTSVLACVWTARRADTDGGPRVGRQRPTARLSRHPSSPSRRRVRSPQRRHEDRKASEVPAADGHRLPGR